MGTDRITEFRDRCRCGTGRLRIDLCSPDHPWITTARTWYEPHIDCPKCGEQFVIEQQGNAFVLVDVGEREQCQRRHDVASARRGQLLREPIVLAALEELRQRLTAAPSTAAQYRLLQAAGLISMTESGFRKRWSGVEAWMRTVTLAGDLPKVFAAVGHSTTQLTVWLQELDALEAAANQPARGTVLHRLA